MKHECKKCSQRCIYFPSDYEEITNEYQDESGVRHRSGILRCEYDNHRIKKFELCPNYLDYGKVR